MCLFRHLWSTGCSMLYRLTLSLAKMLKDRLQDEDNLKIILLLSFRWKDQLMWMASRGVNNRISSLWLGQRYCWTTGQNVPIGYLSPIQKLTSFMESSKYSTKKIQTERHLFLHAINWFLNAWISARNYNFCAMKNQ